MTTFSDPVFTADYQGLCNKIADTLNRQDLTTVIPDFVFLATSTIQRDIARTKHPLGMNRAIADVECNYAPLPTDYVSLYQLMRQDTQKPLEYITPDQSKTILSQGWIPPGPSVLPPDITNSINSGAPTYFTIIGRTLRLFPPPNSSAILQLEIWYYARLEALTTTNTTNWVLTRYPDLYLYCALMHSAPYLMADDRVNLWAQSYAGILEGIAVEAQDATRPLSKLVAARKGF